MLVKSFKQPSVNRATHLTEGCLKEFTNITSTHLHGLSEKFGARRNFNFGAPIFPKNIGERGGGGGEGGLTLCYKTGNYEIYTECHKHTRLY